MMEKVATDPDIKRERSPSYPFISLKRAVERARAIAENHKRSPARLGVIGQTWGYRAKSSGLLQTVAALKQYGLLEDIGGGEDRKIRLSDLAWRILMDTREGVYDQAIKEAALKPKLFAEYANQWIPDRPSESHCISELHLDRGFSEDAAKAFLRAFDETVTFANLKKSDTLSANLEGETVSPETGRITTSSAPPKVTVANRATLPLPEGMAAIEIPEKLSEESYEDLKAWVEVLLKRAGRPYLRKFKSENGD